MHHRHQNPQPQYIRIESSDRQRTNSTQPHGRPIKSSHRQRTNGTQPYGRPIGSSHRQHTNGSHSRHTQIISEHRVPPRRSLQEFQRSDRLPGAYRVGRASRLPSSLNSSSRPTPIYSSRSRSLSPALTSPTYLLHPSSSASTCNSRRAVGGSNSSLNTTSSGLSFQTLDTTSSSLSFQTIDALLRKITRLEQKLKIARGRLYEMQTDEDAMDWQWEPTVLVDS